jgi:hypothetical protein
MKQAVAFDIEKYLVLSGIPRGPKSVVYFVDPVNGSDSNTGTSFKSPLALVSTAYGKCVTGQHDVVILLAGTSSNNETAAITWSKNLTHLIGLGAPTHVSQRSRIVCNAVDLTPFITVSGYGNIFKNLQIWQGQDDATTLINVSVTGNRNYFENVHFAGGGHATQAIDGGMSLQISGGKENLFKGCTIGIDTVEDGTGMAGLSVAATGGAARNKFVDCEFRMFAGHAGAIFVELLGNSGLDRDLTFKNCIFMNLSGTAMTSAFVVAAGFDPANKRVLLKDCALIGATDWDSADRGILYLNNGTLTGGGNAGTFVVSAAT